MKVSIIYEGGYPTTREAMVDLVKQIHYSSKHLTNEVVRDATITVGANQALEIFKLDRVLDNIEFEAPDQLFGYKFKIDINFNGVRVDYELK